MKNKAQGRNNANWERVLPSCLPKDERARCEENLQDKGLNLKEAVRKLMDYCDTPLRQWVNMGRVWCMRQAPGESIRAYSSKFQQARRQAVMEDGCMFVLCFWWGLREDVRNLNMIPLPTNFGCDLPSKLEEMISLVTSTTTDTAALLKNNDIAAWNNFVANHSAANSISSGSISISGVLPRINGRGSKRSSSRGDNKVSNSKKAFDFKQAVKDKVYFDCKAPWVHGHTASHRVSRMAICSSSGRKKSSDNDRGGSSGLSRGDDDDEGDLVRMALDLPSLC
ncbi:unnamed protein product [Mucor hiemalis]